MNLPEPSSTTLRQHLSTPLSELLESFRLGGPAATGTEQSTPPLLADAFEQLFNAMERTEASLSSAGGNPPGREDVTQLGEYALELFDHAMQWANRLDLPEVFQSLQAGTIVMGLWIGAHGGQLLNLEPVVDALARGANLTQDPEELLAIYRAMSAILTATAEVIRRDPEKTNPARPWRILHLNRAIVATRTHRPELMEEAFEDLIQRLPDDAPGFFAQGMEQMDLLNYPPPVRDVMERFYRKWSINRSLH